MYHTRWSQPSPRCWDPDTIFAITNPSTGYPTCIGQAVTCGRRCRRVVARHYVSSATEIANQLAEVSPSAAAESSKLHGIAYNMLCYQHDHQDVEIISTWKRQLHCYDNTQRPMFEFSGKPITQDDDFISFFAGLKRLQEELERRKAEEQARSRRSFPSNGTSTQFSSQRSARGQDDAKTDSTKTEEAKEKIRETQKREDKERALKKAKEREEKEAREREKKAAEEREKKAKEREEKAAKEREEKEAREREEKAAEEREKKAKEREEKAAEERAEKAARERAEKIKEEARRKAQDAKLAEEQKWSNAWNTYNTAWQAIEKSRCKSSRIPWPTLSGNVKDVTEVSVRVFFQRAPPATEDRFCLFSQEAKRWHTDKLLSRLGREVLDGPDKEGIALVTTAMVQRWKDAKTSRTRARAQSE